MSYKLHLSISCKLTIMMMVVSFSFSNLYSQSHRLRLGFEALYSRQISPKLFKDLRKAPNVVNGDVPLNFSSNLANGYDLAFLIGGTIFKAFDLEFNLGTRRAKTALSRQNITNSNLRLDISYVSLSLHLYLFYFDFFNKYFDYDFRRSFFLELSVAYNSYQVHGNWQHTYNNQSRSGSISSSGPRYSYSIGLGYDFYISDKLSLSPYLRYNIIPAVKIDSIQRLIAPPGQGLADLGQYNIAQFQVGIRLGITLIPMKRICPILDCQAQKEHRHARFGKVVLRGNPYNNKQYPLIGQNRHPSFLSRIITSFSRKTKYRKRGPKKSSSK